MKNAVLLLLSFAVLGCATIDQTPYGPGAGVEPFHEFALEPAFDILDLRIDLHHVEVTTTRTQTSYAGGAPMTTTTTTTSEEVNFPLAVHIGNDICVDGKGNVYLSVLDALDVDLDRDFELVFDGTTYSKKGSAFDIEVPALFEKWGKSRVELTPTGMIRKQNKLVRQIDREGETIRFSSSLPVLLPAASAYREADAVIVERKFGAMGVTIDEEGRVRVGDALTVTWKPNLLFFEHRKGFFSLFGSMQSRESSWKAELRKTETGYEWIEQQGWLASTLRRELRVIDGEITVVTQRGPFQSTSTAVLSQ